MKYYDIYAEIMNYFEKELMYYRSKAEQMKYKKKTKRFLQIDDKGMADEIIEHNTSRAKEYKEKIKQVKELFGVDEK